MPRPVRIDFPGAIHHVSNSAIKENYFFQDEADRDEFLFILARTKKEYRMNIFAYALMPDHFHIVLKSIDGRLSDFMQDLQSTYVPRFNSKYDRRGHLVERRYFNEIVQEDQYFYNVIAYVLLNPLRAGYLDAGDYIHPWTSVSEFQFYDSVVDWDQLFEYLPVEPINFLSYLEKNYRESAEFIENNRRQVRRVSIMGDDRFFEKVIEKLEKPVREDEDRSGPVPAYKILEDISNTFNFENVEAFIDTSRDRKNSEFRYLAFYLLKIRSHLTLSEIGDLFDLTSMAVSLGIKKFRNLDYTPQIKEYLKKWNCEPG